MKKSIMVISSILVATLLIYCGYFGYTKYLDYKLNLSLKKILLSQNNRKEEDIIKDYQSLLLKYKNSGKIYIALNNYYIGKNNLSKSVDILYKGIDTSKDKKILTTSLNNSLKNTNFLDGYLRISKGKQFTLKDTVTIKTKNGDSLGLRVNIDTSKVNTSKEGIIQLKGKEKYTGIPIKIDVEVLEDTGNTMGNSLNGGKMAYNDGWIYFADPNNNGLYKMKKDLSQKTKLDDTVEPNFINIKGNSLYFIDRKSGQYGSLIKTDLEGKHKEVIRQNTSYVYIASDFIYYELTKGEHNGWPIVSMNKMNFKHEDVQNDISTTLGGLMMLNSKYIYTFNKYGGFISNENNKYTWGDAEKYKYLYSAEIYNGQIYGTVFTSESQKRGFGKIDIENNSQTLIIDNIENSNSIGRDVYYINNSGIFMADINGENKVNLMDYYGDVNKSSLYALGNTMYVYADEIKIVEKHMPDTSTSSTPTDTPDIKNDEIINLCNDGNKLIFDLMSKRSSNEYKNGNTIYLALKEPYTTKQYIKNELSKYFTKSYVERFMGGSTFIEKDGKLYFIAGDSGMGASYVYTSIKNRDNKENVIHALSYATIKDDNSSADDGDILLKSEDGKWKIDKFHSILQ